MRSFTIISILAAVTYATPPMSFNCGDDLQDICTNMCWGAYCTEPRFGVTLNYDRYGGTGNRNSAVGRARQRSAGCLPRPNRCSVNHNPPGNPGENCDEYPFASTSDADKGGQVTKCVTSSHNDHQGRIIADYIRTSCNNQNCQFIVGFGNPASAGVKYCQAYNDRYNQCTPDGTIYKNGSPDVRPPQAKRWDNSTMAGGLYLMKSGMKVSFGENLEIGTLTKQAQRKSWNSTVHPLASGDDGDDDPIQWDFVDDEIVARLE